MSSARMSWMRSAAHILPPANLLLVIECLIVFLLFAFSAAAQEKTKDLTELNLEDLMNVKVYGASKHMENASDAPSSNATAHQ